MLRLYTSSYGTPGDVEHFDVSKPATVAEWVEAVEKVVSKGGQVMTTTYAPSGGATKEMAVNYLLVERAVQV